MRTYTLTVDDRTFTIAVRRFTPQEALLEVNGQPYTVRVDEVVDERPVASPVRRAVPAAQSTPSAAPAAAAGTAAGSVAAPIPGLILEVFVRKGDAVKSGQPVVKMEAMKMETVLNAATGGTVQDVRVKAGDSVNQGQALVEIG